MWSKISLYSIAFLSGALVMIFEIIGARILAPYIGTSFFVWTALIGFVLASLSLGNYMGGKWIDKKPTLLLPAISLFFASVSLAIVILFKDQFLIWMINHVIGIKASAIIASIVLFVPASVFFGSISPMIAKLLLVKLDSAGRTMGNIYAFSSVGSLIGTFLAGFYLLPNYGINSILIGVFLVSMAPAFLIFLLKKNWVWIALCSILILGIGFNSINKTSNPKYILEEESQYNSIKVYPTIDHHTKDSILIMQLGMQRAGGMSIGNRPLPFNYLYYFRLAEHFNPKFSSALMLGGAAYGFPKYYLRNYPSASIDVIEIDEKLTEIAKNYFNLNTGDKNLNIYHEDARTYINRCNKKYDVIYSDTFRNAISLPYQLTTVEAIQKQYDLLNDGGVVMVNVIQAVEGESSLFLQAEMESFKKVFPQVLLFADAGPEKRSQIQSTIIVAIKSNHQFEYHSTDLGIDTLMIKQVLGFKSNQQALYDDYAPVDYLAFRGL